MTQTVLSASTAVLLLLVVALLTHDAVAIAAALGRVLIRIGSHFQTPSERATAMAEAEFEKVVEEARNKQRTVLGLLVFSAHFAGQYSGRAAVLALARPGQGAKRPQQRSLQRRQQTALRQTSWTIRVPSLGLEMEGGSVKRGTLERAALTMEGEVLRTPDGEVLRIQFDVPSPRLIVGSGPHGHGIVSKPRPDITDPGDQQST